MFNYRETFELPFKYKIPNKTNQFFRERKLIKNYFKFLKRKFFIYITGQRGLKVDYIDSKAKRILWINMTAPSLGDSLMDLSGRSLINNKCIDLFTDHSNAFLFENDKFFRNVYSQVADVKSKYDLVIIDSFSPRSFSIKVQVAKTIPYVGLFGFYNGPEVNRVLFSHHRINHLQGYEKSKNEINHTAKNHLFINQSDKKYIDSLKLPEKFYTIVIGGEWGYRTYNDWESVIKKIREFDKYAELILVGSINGKSEAEKIHSTDPLLINFVAKLTFLQTAEVINRSRMTLCCDGGLMHAANALDTPVLCLFARLSENMRLTRTLKYSCIEDKENVNNITALEVFDEFTRFNQTL